MVPRLSCRRTELSLGKKLLQPCLQHGTRAGELGHELCVVSALLEAAGCEGVRGSLRNPGSA